MEIEAADASEAEAVADLWVELAADQRRYGSHLLAEENHARIRESLVRHAVTGTLLVACEDGEIAGFVTFSVETGAYKQDVRRGVIENLFVAPAARDGGIGSNLLAAAETALAGRDVDVVALEAMAENDDARAFYRRHGYEPHRVEFEKRLESDTHTKADE